MTSTSSRYNPVAVSTVDQDADRAARSEQALLGALLLDSRKAWPAVKDLVTADHLRRHDHRLIFRGIASLIDEAGVADPYLLADQLGNDLNEAGGVDYIAHLVECCPSAANAAAYAKTVREYAGRSKVIDLAQKLGARASLQSADEVSKFAAEELERIQRDHATVVEPLDLTPVSKWADGPEPAPREWLLESLIPAGRVTSLLGVGGYGKTLLALQIALHISEGRDLFGLKVKAGPVLGIFCEDEEDELNRRLRAACGAEGISLGGVERLVAISRDGLDSYLCSFDHDRIQLTAFYRELEATIAELKPALVILDTAADLFAGDFMSTPHVRQFLKIALGGLCTRHGCAILLLAHPSASGAQSGDGGGFSTAWNNSVRSRLYLTKPKAPEGEDEPPADLADKRVLQVKKSNYGPDDVTVPLTYVNGYFIRDDEPIEEGSRISRASANRILFAALEYIRAQDPAVVGFRQLFEQLQASGVIPPGQYDLRRKPLSRALKQLMADNLVYETTTPRGYRAVR